MGETLSIDITLFSHFSSQISLSNNVLGTPVLLIEQNTIRTVVHRWRGLLCRFGRQSSRGLAFSYLIAKNASYIGMCR